MYPSEPESTAQEAEAYAQADLERKFRGCFGLSLTTSS
jgi:hypothetical protein